MYFLHLNLLWNKTLQLCLILKTQFSLGLIKWIEIFTQRCRNASIAHSHMATITKPIFTLIWNHWRHYIVLYETKFYVHYTWTRCLILLLQVGSYLIILHKSVGWVKIYFKSRKKSSFLLIQYWVYFFFFKTPFQNNF